MSLFKKLFGKTKRLPEVETENKTPVASQQELFEDKLSKWEPPIIVPPRRIGDFILNKKYVYKDVELREIPDNFIFNFNIPGKEVTLNKINEHDNLDIAVHMSGRLIGYIPKNKLESMIHDYMEREQPIYSVISNVHLKDGTKIIDSIYILLCFYYNPFSKFDDKLSAKLIRTSKKDFFDISRQENYLYANKGDYVELVYEFDSDSYIVLVDDNEIGETNASVTKKLQEFDSSCDYIGVIEEITEDDTTGKYGAIITIAMK